MPRQRPLPTRGPAAQRGDLLVIASFRLGAKLCWPTDNAARLRTAMMVTAAAVASAAMLGLLAVRHAEQVLNPLTYADPDFRRLLLATVVAVSLPLLTLLAVAAKLSARLRERRLANLRLLGLSLTRTRIVAATEVAVAALAGALIGILLFAACRPLLVALNLADRKWTSTALTPTAIGYVAVVLAVPVVVAVVASSPRRAQRAGALQEAHEATASRPSWWRLAPLVLGFALSLYVIRQASQRVYTDNLIGPFFAGTVLLGVGVLLVVPVLVRLLADLMLAAPRQAALVIAGRRLQAQPAGVNRVISGLLIGLFLVTGAWGIVAAFESTPQYEAAAQQVEVQQTAATLTTGLRADAEVARAAALPGVRLAIAFPKLEALCRPGTACPAALVASCAQLRAVFPGIAGCTDQHVMWTRAATAYGASRFSSADSPERQAHRWVAGTASYRPREGRPTLSLPAPTSFLAGVDDLMNNTGASIVVPPRLAVGSPVLTADTATFLYVTAAPGRGLSETLAQSGFLIYGGTYFGDYDLTAKIRALVWTVATVIVSIGLLTFAIGAIDRAVARRREVMSLQLVGVSQQLLRVTQVVEAAAPLVFGCLLAITCGAFASATYLSMGGPGSAVPWRPAIELLGIATIGSVAVAALTVVASSPRIRPDLIRSE